MEKVKEKQLGLNEIFSLYKFDNREKFHLSKKFNSEEKTEQEWIKVIKKEGFEIIKF